MTYLIFKTPPEIVTIIKFILEIQKFVALGGHSNKESLSKERHP